MKITKKNVVFDGKNEGFKASTRTSSSRKPQSSPVCVACPASTSLATAEHAWVWWKS